MRINLTTDNGILVDWWDVDAMLLKDDVSISRRYGADEEKELKAFCCSTLVDEIFRNIKVVKVSGESAFDQ